ncbi:MAG: hypothetical protein SW833_04420 [Cyanobacteriota bacterium]|nr:hypothetical protein [Cyanobacteriota bacterium]
MPIVCYVRGVYIRGVIVSILPYSRDRALWRSGGGISTRLEERGEVRQWGDWC